jgi:hypothetical protein
MGIPATTEESVYYHTIELVSWGSKVLQVLTSVNWSLQMCKFQNNTSVSISADRGGGETTRASLNMTNAVNWNKFASSSSITEQALWARLTGLDQMVRDHGQSREEGIEGMKNMLTIRPGACLGGMAGQCPRVRPGATEGWLHRSTAGSTTNGASTGVHSLTEISSKKHSRQ